MNVQSTVGLNSSWLMVGLLYSMLEHRVLGVASGTREPEESLIDWSALYHPEAWGTGWGFGDKEPGKSNNFLGVNTRSS